jgi:uncharacterized membrane protein
MKQLGNGITVFAAWVGFAAVANGCGGWVDLKSSEGAAGSATGGSGSVIPSAGSSQGGSASIGTGGSPPASAGTNATGGQADAGAEPFEILVAPEPTLFPPGADGPGVTWTASIKVYAGSLGAGALAGTAEYCFKKPLSGYRCDWQSYEPFVWTEEDGLVTLDLADLGGSDHIPTRVTPDGKTVVGSFRKDNQTLGLFRWTKAGGATGLGEPTGSTGFEYLSDDGTTVAGMFKTNDKGHLNFVWTEADGFQPLDEASGWPSAAQTEVRGLSADGLVIAGATVGVEPSQVFRYTEGEVEQFGSLPDFPRCDLTYGAVTRDGETVYGGCTSEDQQSYRAFRWTEANGLEALSNASCEMKSVLAISGSGTVTFGMGSCDGASGLVRWTDGASGMILSAAPAGFQFEGVRGTSHDGGAAIGVLRAVSGEPTGTGAPPLPGEEIPITSTERAFRWTETDGVDVLPLTSGQSYSSANAIAPSGDVIVGRAGQADNAAKAVLWDDAGQLELEAYLESQGVDLQGVELNTAQDVVVRDGIILILGYADAANLSGAWLARIPLVRP